VHWAAVTPGDLPDLSPALVDRLLATARAEGNRVVIPVLASGDQRNPVVWPRRFFAELARLEGDVGGRKLVEAHSAQVVRLTVDEPSQFTDIDRPEDLTARHERPDKAPR
jgi:molybdenum cofactor cytidylyltransferase